MSDEGVGAAAGHVTASLVQQHVDRLLACLEPNGQCEMRRHVVGCYVNDLIKRCFSRQRKNVDAFMFGSVPLKTYLPDGDVDISIFYQSTTRGLVNGVDKDEQRMRETWAFELKKYLDELIQQQQQQQQVVVSYSVASGNGSVKTAKSVSSTGSGTNTAVTPTSSSPGILEVQDCQIIQAEVKLVKCIVSGLVVDVSFNALGGLCAVAFLEWFDRIIGRSHLLKKSIVLIKAWCYYESRLLGAHHGLLSSYAVEVMVLFVINVYGSELASPLEVFHRFLQVFAEFDFERYCLSMLGPIPLDSFPHPHIDEQQLPPGSLTVSAASLRDAVMQCSANPKVSTAAIECLSPELSCTSSHQPKIQFARKHVNIMDPLLPSNNLGRSVNRSSHARMKMAFSQGATTLTRVLQSEPSGAEQKISLFFSHTWASTHRMSIENRMFSSMAAFVPPEYLMMPHGTRQHHFHSGHAWEDGTMMPSSSNRKKHGSTISLPDLSSRERTNSTSEPNNNEDDSLETHDGTSISPIRPQSTEDLPGIVESGQNTQVKSQPQPQVHHHRRSHSVTTSLGGSGQTIHHFPGSMHAINFVGGSNNIGDVYTSNMSMLLNNIAVARRCQPLGPSEDTQSSKESTGIRPDSSTSVKNTHVVHTVNGADGEDAVQITTHVTSAVPAKAPVTYASVTAHGLTPTTRSRALSRRGSMSVNASVSVSPRSETSPANEKPGEKKLTSEMLSHHAAQSNPVQHIQRKDALPKPSSIPDDQNHPIDAHSLSQKLKTWSIIAAQKPPGKVMTSSPSSPSPSQKKESPS
ncbi:hypothetical protein PSENEW3_00006233 [Picochlorum sp. SENEW3]|nr:hypothetical protein PSENEW3_00006233 [Picochlorum sp. SENEW3]